MRRAAWHSGVATIVMIGCDNCRQLSWTIEFRFPVTVVAGQVLQEDHPGGVRKSGIATIVMIVPNAGS